ncbi:PhzF family phenazine biosynthesis protein [Jannaschia sp. LMIT008]|uniref:PhzF family phenazine biosynthesis protein n=1 Tax=Jannaschia maritima TaxID=3032585 RepID=UPI002811828C|nr:PhzF family phenazine biosynthesis protein [Jannaschia sp. LMIT008]
MHQVDAFADRPFAGNPAAVVILDDWLAEPTMGAIAAENNLPETAFARRRPDGDWDLRWFTPTQEVDFCGHATLATAHVLMAEDGHDGPVSFHARVGTLRVARDGGGYAMDVPSLPPDALDDPPPELDGAFDRPPHALFRNFENLFADLGSEGAVRAFVPDLPRLTRLGRMGLCVTGRGDAASGADFVSRYFAPGGGIPEDPVTGSTHATLVPYWSERLGRTSLRAHQASARGGWLDCDLSGSRVTLRGRAVTFLAGHVRLPPDMG